MIEYAARPAGWSTPRRRRQSRLSRPPKGQVTRRTANSAIGGGASPDPGTGRTREGDPVSHGINVLPKYVPSSTLKDPGRNTHVINGDVEAAVRELKAKPGRELQVHGSGDLLRWLLQRDLVDEINLRLYPVVVGDGLRLFPERGQTHDLTLVESRSAP